MGGGIYSGPFFFVFEFSALNSILTGERGKRILSGCRYDMANLGWGGVGIGNEGIIDIKVTICLYLEANTSVSAHP